MIPFRKRLLNGEVIFGQMVLELFTSGIGQMLAASGMEFVIFDMEHGKCDIALLADMIAGCRGSGIFPMARVPDMHFAPLSRVLDVGARGVMVPRVETRAQAEEIVAQLKYAPAGRRGVALGVAHDLYHAGGTEFFKQANEDTVVILLLETAKAFENLDEIVSVPGVDIAWMGHYDLTVSMGIPAQFEHSRFLEAMDALVSSCRRHGVAPGFLPATPEGAVHWIRKGFRALSLGSDIGVFMNGIRSFRQTILNGAPELAVAADSLMKYSIQAFSAGTFWVPGPEVYWMQHWNTREEMNLIIYLIRGGGHNILINTGPPQDLTEINAGWLAFFGYPEAQIVRSEEQRPENILRSQGLSVADIDTVIVTPLQAYATANIHLFRNAQICISRKGWIEDFQAPYYHLHVPRRLRIPPEVNNYLQNEGWEHLRLLADEEEIFEGLRVFWAGVHHRSSLAVCIDTEKGTTAITDSFFKYGNLEQGHYLGVMESMMEADATWARIRREAKIAASIYDPEVFVRHPGGVLA